MGTPSGDSGTSSDSGTVPTAPPACYVLEDAGGNGQYAVSRVPPAGGAPVVLQTFGGPQYLHSVHTLVWFDNRWFFGDGWQVWSLVPGNANATLVGNGLVMVVIDGKLAVQPYFNAEWTYYDNALDFLAGNPSWVGYEVWDPGSRAGSDGGATIYGSSHSTSTVEVIDTLADSTTVLALENYDTWVWGIGVLNGHVHLLDDGRQAPNGDTLLRSFDPVTGAEQSRVVIATAMGAQGLWCGAR